MGYKVDKIDRKILHELDRNARIPDTRLGKKVGRSKESIRYRINKLMENDIITRFYTFIDPTKLGYQTYKVYLKLANKPDARDEFVQFVKDEKRLFWLGMADGAWDVGLTFFAQNNEEFYELKNMITSKFEDLILEKHTGVIVDVMVCNKDFFIEETTDDCVTLFREVEDNEIDETDKKILKLLFNDARMNMVDIARETDTSIDIVRGRMKKMEEMELILQYKAAINHNALGQEFYKTFLYFNKISKEDEQRIIQYVKNHPKILHLVRQITPWDMELEIMVENYLEYNELINKLRREFVNIITDVESAIMGEDHIFPAEKMFFED